MVIIIIIFFFLGYITDCIINFRDILLFRISIEKTKQKGSHFPGKKSIATEKTGVDRKQRVKPEVWKAKKDIMNRKSVERDVYGHVIWVHVSSSVSVDVASLPLVPTLINIWFVGPMFTRAF